MFSEIFVCPQGGLHPDPPIPLNADPLPLVGGPPSPDLVTATAAVGTHPTGMHSYLEINLLTYGKIKNYQYIENSFC